MPESPFSEEQVKNLRARWNRDAIIKIVIALNEGNPVEPLLSDIPKPDEMPLTDRKLDLRGIDLSYQNLRGPWVQKDAERYRRGITLASADLSAANFSWAILPKADLCNAILIDADLDYAELIYADFSGADLTGAKLDSAWMLDTKFQNAKITEEQLRTRRALGQLDFDYHAFEI